MIAFYHQNPDERHFLRATVALDLPSKDTLVEALETGTDVLLTQLGISWVHPKDHLDKRVGREIAVSRLVPTVAYLKHIEVREDNRVVYNYTINIAHRGRTYILSFGVSFIPKNKNTRLEYALLQGKLDLDY